MNDQAVIRKAVELADGWNMDEQAIVLHACSDFCFIDDPDQYILDALAAQLVRQVDALDDVEFSCNEYGTAVVIHQRAARVQCTGRNEGPDRTMNTLRAIVESGVLDER